ncbi:MAG: aminopeptidase [Thermomicrobiales bacterium]
MADPRIAKWAKALVHYSVSVKPGQTVVITGGVSAATLIREVHREVIAAGAFPVVTASLDGISRDLLKFGSNEQLAYISPIETFVRSQADVVINIMAESNTRRASSVDPSRSTLFSAARSELFEQYMERASDGRLDWTLTLYPTDGYAQDADMDTEEYTDFVLSACKLDQDDPVAAWQELRGEQQRLIDWLNGRKEIHLVAPDVDLTMSVEGRTWINSDGRRNFPSGEIFTGPVENSANGTIRFSFPVVTAGRQIEDIRLKFVDGKVVEATAAKNEDYLIKTLDTDPGARFLGEIAFGTNMDIQRFTKNILFDEKIGGTVHMAVGRGYPETGSTNKSAVHWDMISDIRAGGEVTVDGELFLKDGKFVV